MNKNQKVIYEYNETNGNFHENLGDYPENTALYKTVCYTTYGELDRFRFVLNAAYRNLLPDGTWKWRHGTPSLDDIKALWEGWKQSISEL